MAEMGEALLARAKADSGLAAIFGSRIYWNGQVPQNAGYPRLVLLVIGGERPQHLGGFEDMAEATVQASSFASKYGQARDGAEAAIAALLPEASHEDIVFWRGSAREPIDLGDQSEAEGFIFHAAVDLTLRWGRSAA